jgi:hypothetical protein
MLRRFSTPADLEHLGHDVTNIGFLRSGGSVSSSASGTRCPVGGRIHRR